MNPLSKRKMNVKCREYIMAHPGCSHPETVKALNYPELSKGYFFNMKVALRKKGLIPKEGKEVASIKSKPTGKQKMTRTVSTKAVQLEILGSFDVTGFSQEIRDHYKSHVLPLLQKLVPQGKTLSMVFLTDPPLVEIRRTLP